MYVNNESLFATVQRDCFDLNFASVICMNVNHPQRVGGSVFESFL